MIHIGAFGILCMCPTIKSCCLSHVERLGNGAYSPHWSHRVARHPTPSLVFTCKYYQSIPPEFAKEVFDCLSNLLPTITPWSRLHARDVNSAALFKTGASRCRYHCSAVGRFLGMTIKKLLFDLLGIQISWILLKMVIIPQQVNSKEIGNHNPTQPWDI